MEKILKLHQSKYNFITMKYALVLLLLCTCKIVKANRIDNLQNEADVEKFIISIDDDIRKNLDRWPVKILNEPDLRHTAEPVGKTQIRYPASWVKVDLNDDGQTDLIVYTRYYGVLIVMDTGNNGYKAIRLKSYPSVPVIMPRKISGHTVLLEQHIDCPYDDATKKASLPKAPDTLIYKFGQFVEINNDPADYKIASVCIFTGLCALGPCKSYKLVVDVNGQARYIAGTEMPNQGVFTAQLTPVKTKQVIDLVNYIKVKNMNDRYQPGCILDGGGWQLVVTFKDGSEKKIFDFNSGGTFGLEAVYAVMDDIAKTQTWIQIK